MLARAALVTGAVSADFNLLSTLQEFGTQRSPLIHLEGYFHVYMPDHGQKLVCPCKLKPWWSEITAGKTRMTHLLPAPGWKWMVHWCHAVVVVRAQVLPLQPHL